ncbi:unnamed protein product [Linum trigynum]|uniref:Uncharacterized protein n=1 Tax=Linum trigynum TaxID=586398 RepID=A0AAV2E0U3_9ROSI
MALHNFSLDEKMDDLFRCAVNPNESIPISSLKKFPRVLHYFITHVFLPGSHSFDIVTRLDLWVLVDALAERRLDYSHLVFGCMVRASSEEYIGCLLFGGYISLLMASLHIPLKGFVLEEESVTVPSLNILRKYAIPRRPVTMAEEDILATAQDVADQVDRGRKRIHGGEGYGGKH